MAQRDPNLDHPAVRMHREIVHRWPNHVQRKFIISTIDWATQEMGFEADRALLIWQTVLIDYMATGKNVMNTKYMLDLYEEKIRGPKWDRHNRR